MIELIDTHTHLFVEEFDDDRDAAVQRAIEAGISRLCLPCITEDSVAPMMDMCRRHPDVCRPMIGLHPTEVDDAYIERLAAMRALTSVEHPFIAVGEVGLDFYWDDSRRTQQMDAFERQIEWARDMRLPLVIHSRNAFEELCDVMERHRADALTGVFHCFTGTHDEARRLLTYGGFMLGIGGVLTYKKSSLPDVLASTVPLDRIVLETDSPYLAPVPHRGRRNESAYMVDTAEFLARVYGMDVDSVARITTENARRVFTKI